MLANQIIIMKTIVFSRIPLA